MAMAMRGMGGGPWDKLMERFKDQKRAEFRFVAKKNFFGTFFHHSMASFIKY